MCNLPCTHCPVYITSVSLIEKLQENFMKRSKLLLLALIAHIAYSQDDIIYDGDLRAVLDAQKGQSAITIPKGTYLLDMTGNNGAYVFSGLKDVQINGNGALVICNYQKQAFTFSNCENVTFSDLAIDYEPPCSTQGTITDISGNESQNLEVQIHDGYPLVNPSYGQDRVQIYDRNNRELIQDFFTCQINSQIEVNAEERKVTCKLDKGKNGVYEVGDYIVFNNLPANHTGHTIIVRNCKDMKFDKITVYDSSAFSILETECDNSHYYQCVLDRRTNDPRRTEDRLRAGVADGIHSKYATKGPTIEECTLRYMGDDPVAINGNFYPVYKIVQNRKTIYVLSSESLNNVKFKKEDNIVIVNNNGSKRGSGVASNVTAATTPTAAEKEACFGMLDNVRDKDGFGTGIAVIFDNDEWENVKETAVGDVLYSDDRIGNGFKVINNYVGHNRSRGILIKAGDGVIQGNTIVRTTGSAIALAPEFYWMEAGLSKNVDISNNTIETCMYGESEPWAFQAAALTVVCQSPKGPLGEVGAFHNIRIHRNTIKDCPKPCVFLNGIDGGSYYQNTIIPADWTRRHGMTHLIPNNSEYFTKNVRNINTDDDPASNTLPTIKKEEHLIRIDADGYIYFSDNFSGFSKLSVYNMLGDSILQDEFEYYSSISLNSLEKGLYILSVKNKNKIYTEKYVVR